MNLTHILLAELQRESGNTRKLLEKVPEENFAWQPHAKSMTLVNLAAHIAEIPGLFIAQVIGHEMYDFSIRGFKRASATSTTDLLNQFDTNVRLAEEALQKATDEELAWNWSLRNGEKVILTLPKRAIIRTLALNHVVHHRGQLSVFLRLLDIPVPGVYGPSADETFF